MFAHRGSHKKPKPETITCKGPVRLKIMPRHNMRPLSLFHVGHLPLVTGLPLGVVCSPSETPLEKSNFSFACSYLWELASVLGMRRVSTSPFSSMTLSGPDLCRPCASCHTLSELLCKSWHT